MSFLYVFKFYSVLKARMGSTVAARRAGSQLATMAAHNNTSATTATAPKSIAATP
jgi:hypothetical protein